MNVRVVIFSHNYFELCTRKTLDSDFIDTYFSGVKELARNFESVTKEVSIVYGIDEFKEDITKSNNTIYFSTWNYLGTRNQKSIFISLCQAYHAQYIGADQYLQTVGQDKMLSKMIANQFNIAAPPAIRIDKVEDIKDLAIPFSKSILKPIYEGESIGINLGVQTSNEELISNANQLLLNSNDSIMIERFVNGTEYNICLFIDSKNQLKTSVVKVNDYEQDGLYNYEKKRIVDKYSKKYDLYNLNEVFNDYQIQNITNLFYHFKDNKFLRIDGFLDINKKFWLLEITQTPGIYPNSSFVHGMRKCGYTYSDFLKELILTSIQ
ncbi:hypothetical protein [Candidatus Izimaplasma sp. ZiA1]|uniref:hypothetical protein n=1 Tax=Candidatus Izimoplasma sp. ZiA1 TaxID=2024899 RepID=UPI00143B7215